MPSPILAVGYSRDKFKQFQRQVARWDVTIDYAESPYTMKQLLHTKTYSCILCDIGILDSVSYLCVIQRVTTIPIIFGSTQSSNFENIVLSCIEFSTPSKQLPRIQRFPQIDLSNESSIIKGGEITINTAAFSVSVREHRIHLTAKEFDILALLLSNPKRVFTYEMIMDIVWQEPYTFYARKLINNHVSNIKRKIRPISSDDKSIVTVHGVGYKFHPK